MKKILFSLLLFFFFLPVCFAEHLNFRTNQLMDYHLVYEDKNEIVLQLTNNKSEKLIYTINPKIPLDYITNYESIENAFLFSDQALQNKIKKYIRFTEQETDSFSKINYYVITQKLIWEVFHPEISFQISNDKINFYQKNMEEKIELVPNWIQDYEFVGQLKIKREKDYKLTSNDCEIKEEQNDWIISKCQENATIKVEEVGNEELFFYQNQQQLIGIESGFSPCVWYFQVTEKEELKEPILPEIMPPIINKPNEKVEISDQKDEVVMNPVNDSDSKEEKYPIYNVPNTKENGSIWSFILIIVFLELCLEKRFSF